VAGKETRLPPARRHLKGLVVADVPMKFQDAEVRDFYCRAAASDQSRMEAGEYQDGSGAFANAMGDLAAADPVGGSPLVPGFTNAQLALVFGAQTSVFDGNLISWHFVGGGIDPETGLARGLTYTESGLWLDLLRSLPPYMPLRQALDLDTMFCGNEDVTFDDHLGDIRLPLLYAGAPGGYGEYGEYTTTLTASDDVQTFTVQVDEPPPTRALGFGHGDLFLARDARELAWERVRQWLVDHRR
jgi:hypothetical protein